MKMLRLRRREGSILALSLFLLVTVFAILAFSIDLGYIYAMKSQMQRAADASALAAGWSLLDDSRAGVTESDKQANAWGEAVSFASRNAVGQVDPRLTQDDVTVGYLATPSDRSEDIVVGSSFASNAVTVRIRRTEGLNGEIPMFFARTLGISSMAQEIEASAAFWPGVRGFRITKPGDTLDILPFALDADTWNDMMRGVGNDDFAWDEATGQVTSGHDGAIEINLYPQGTGMPGNRGTVDVGSSNNSTSDIARQIVHGVNQSDLDALGTPLELDANNQLMLNGDTGISAGVKDELQQIIGLPRVVPVFDQAAGNGNNANYRIVKWAGVRIVEVHLEGKMNGKRVLIQPCSISVVGAIPSDDPGLSDYVFTPVTLVR